ncbi:MAG: MerR family transcriptional regulator [Bacteriovoracaceae bacterium]
MSESVEIPNKSFFNLNEVCSITAIKPYVLRFWETEFPSLLNPVNSESGQKLYTGKDIEAFLLIKKYLFDEKIPIAEAKLILKEGSHEKSSISTPRISRVELSEKEIESIALAKVEARKILLTVSGLREKYKI